MDKTEKSIDRTVSARNAVGVLWSACPSDKLRRASIDLGLTVWRAGQNDQFAGNRSIALTTLVPSFSWSIFSDTRYDVLDAGISGGVYWFTSPGFPSVSGVILEPWFDIHAPSSWSASGWAKRLAGVPTLRLGAVTFPGGFEPNVFNATGDKARRISAELIPTFSVFINLAPLVPHMALRPQRD